ncbi:MAG: ABC transporter permease [Burkholderiales bacterium]|nr:ABC transporter permease [Burkholderiales bacterium]
MKLRDFKIGWRLLIQEPAYSAVVVLGLCVGFAACILLLGFVRFSLSYDASVPDLERVVVVKQKFNVVGRPEWMQIVPLPFRDLALQSGMVEAASGFLHRNSMLKTGARSSQIEITAVDVSFPQMWGIQALQGDLAAALSRPDALALTVDAAEKVFGHTQVVGQTVQIDGKSYLVAALLPDPPGNTTAPYAALTGVNTALWPPEEREEIVQGLNWVGGVLLKLKPGVTATALTQALQAKADSLPLRTSLPPEALQRIGDKRWMEVGLVSLADAYFDADLSNSHGSGERGNKRMVLGLGAVALLILLLASANYINLATVRSLRRQREIAMRQVLGAGKYRIVGQFMAESALAALLACALGLVLAWLALPLFSELMGRKLAALLSPASIAVSLLLACGIGLLAGIYPAWQALGTSTAAALSGRENSEGRSGLWLRRAMTVLQFATAICLAAVTLTIVWQTYFASRIDPGFDPRPLLVLDVPGDPNSAAAQSFRAALRRLPGVSGVAGADDAVGRRSNFFYGDVKRAGGEFINARRKSVDADFFQVYGIAANAGRLFDASLDQTDKSELIVINLALARKLGYATPQAAVGQALTGNENEALRVIGVAPDIRYQSLRQSAEPMLYRLNRSRAGILTLRSTGDMAAVRSAAEALAKKHFSVALPQMHGAQEFLATNYADDLRLAKLLAGASLVAVALAAFGIYVLSAYNVRRREREIVLRKLYGANRPAIARLLGLEFLSVLGVAALLGLPPAAVATEHYLAGFVERAAIGAWTLIAAMLLACSVVLLATVRHTREALRLRPALALRS